MKKTILIGIFLLSLFLVRTSVALAAEAATGDPVEKKSCEATFPGHSCMDKNSGKDCRTGYCSGGDNNQCCVGVLPNPLGTTNINTFVATLINNILGFVGTISLLLFIYGGIIWMTSAGAPAKVKQGRDVLVWAVIGMAVVFMSYILVKFVIQGVQGVV